MADKKLGHQSSSVNAFLYAKLSKHLEDIRTVGLPYKEPSDIMNSLMLEYLLKLYPDDPELLEIVKIIETKHIRIQSAVVAMLKRHRPLSN